MDAPVLRNRLKVLRAEHNLTQAELAERIRVSRKSINAIETGHMTPSVALALKLAAALQVPLEQLFSLEPETGAGASAPLAPQPSGLST